MGLRDSTTLAPQMFEKPRYVEKYEELCLSAQEVKHVYKKVENGEIVTPLAIVADQQKNPEHKAHLSNTFEDNPFEKALTEEVDFQLSTNPESFLTSSDAAWSLLSTEPVYRQYCLSAQNCQYTPIVHSNLFKSFEKGPHPSDIFDCDSSQIDPLEYLDQFEEVHSQLTSGKQFDDTSDVSTTYLGKTCTKIREFHIENQIELSANSTAQGTLLDGTPIKVLFDTGASKSYMPKKFYDSHPNLYQLPKFHVNGKGIIVGNGETVPILFVIPVLVDINNHRFEIFTLVSSIHDHIDLVFGLKNMVETEGVFSARDNSFKFLCRSIPIYPLTDTVIEAGRKVSLKLQAPFCD